MSLSTLRDNRWRLAVTWRTGDALPRQAAGVWLKLTAAGWQRLWLWTWPLPALAAALAAGGGSRAAALIAFFAAILLWPATLLVDRLAGAAPATIAATVCAALLAAGGVLPSPSPKIQTSLAERRFDAPQQAARHTLRLPVTSRAWRALWSRSPTPLAYLYVLSGSDERVSGAGLVVQLGDRQLGEITVDTRLLDAGQGDHLRFYWNRLPVQRADLEATARLEVRLAPNQVAAETPGSVALMGGYSYRPTDPPTPSAFFDGQQWTTDLRTMLPDVGQQSPMPVRYFVELRIVDPKNKRVLADYY